MAVIAFVCALSFNTTPAFAKAEQFQSIKTIKAAAQAFLDSHNDIQSEANTTVSIGNIDARLTLPRCDTPLDTFLPSGANVQGKTTVGVRCQSPRPWTLYVPANITTFKQILLTNSPMRRGQVITPEDISLKFRDASLLNKAFLSDPKQAIGKVLKKNLSRQALLTKAVLAEPQLIRKDQHVELQAGSHGLRVSVAAIALHGGAVGEKIRVKNLSSNKIVEGTILASGVIQAN